jgi:hypothetical protein
MASDSSDEVGDTSMSRPTKGTKAFEQADAGASHEADRMPTPDEADLADEAAQDPNISGDHQDVAKHYKDMTDRGVAQEGEGRIE